MKQQSAKITPKKTRTRKPTSVKIEAVGEDGLTDKQRAFVSQYLICWNASEAARRAGYSVKSAYSIGSENLTKPNIRQAIDERLNEYRLSADEVIARLSVQATADMSDFLAVSGRGIRIDLKRAAELGKLGAIRKYTKTEKGFSIELVDSQAALVQLGRHYALFTDNIRGDLGVLRIGKRAEEMSDDELAAIASGSLAGGRTGTAPTPSGA